MSEAPGHALRGVVLCHGAMADGLVDAVRRIAGLEEEDPALIPLSNQGMSPEMVLRRIRELVQGAPAIVFTDLQSGSCAIAGRRLCQERGELVVVSGVNLPLLLEFVLHRDMPLQELVPRLLEKGRNAIAGTPVEREDHGDRAVSSG